MLELIHHFGYLGIFTTIFLEIAFMIFPLPGDTLLFTLGIVSESGMLNYKFLLFISIFASFLSGHVGYFIGTKINRDILLDNKIYKIKDSHLHKTEKFFERYGFYAIMLSRFVPIVRNFISQLMGIIKYDKKHFFWANLLASIIWPLTIISLGYVFGKMFPKLIVYAEYGMVLVLFVLSFPVLHELWKNKGQAKG
jgi:membrane-associated protein